MSSPTWEKPAGKEATSTNSKQGYQDQGPTHGLGLALNWVEPRSWPQIDPWPWLWAGPSSGHRLTLDSGPMPSPDSVLFLSFQTQCKGSGVSWPAQGNLSVNIKMSKCVEIFYRNWFGPEDMLGSMISIDWEKCFQEKTVCSFFYTLGIKEGTVRTTTWRWEKVRYRTANKVTCSLEGG